MSEPTVLALISGRDPELHTANGHVAYVRAHARAAIRAGYHPHILCVGTTKSVRETDLGTVRRILSPSRYPRPLQMPVHGPLLTRALLRLARERPGPLLAHGFGTWSWAGVRACARLRAEGRTAVPVANAYATYPSEAASQVRGLPSGTGRRIGLQFRAAALWTRAVIARYEGFAYRNAAAVFVNYEAVRRLIVADYGPQVPVELLPYGPEVDFLPATEATVNPAPPGVTELEPPDAPLVACIAFGRPRKGVDVLIDALALARDRGCPLRACMMGQGPLVETHRRRVIERGLSGSAAVLGPVPDVEPYLRAADIYVQPSRAEQSGSVALLEALRARVPAVASRVDGIPEDVDDGESALLVQPGDPEELASALIRLARHPALRERIGSGGRKRFKERFAAAPFSAALGDAYAKLGFDA
jgi:glycosyltransferase involved in cell wall biosynthesis